MKGIGGGLHPAVDGHSLREFERTTSVCTQRHKRQNPPPHNHFRLIIITILIVTHIRAPHLVRPYVLYVIEAGKTHLIFFKVSRDAFIPKRAGPPTH